MDKKSKDYTKGIGSERGGLQKKNTGKMRGVLVNVAWAIFAFVVFAVISLMNRGIV
jgi:hypothetical protein